MLYLDLSKFDKNELKKIAIKDAGFILYMVGADFQVDIQVNGVSMFLHHGDDELPWVSVHLTLRDLSSAIYRLMMGEKKVNWVVHSNEQHVVGKIILSREDGYLLFQPESTKYHKSPDVIFKTDFQETAEYVVKLIGDYKQMCHQLAVETVPNWKHELYLMFELYSNTEMDKELKKDQEKVKELYLKEPERTIFYPWVPLEEAWEEYKEKHNIEDSLLVKKDFFSQDLTGKVYDSEKYSEKDIKTFLHEIGYETEDLNFEGKEAIHVVDTDVYIEKSERNADENSSPKIRFDNYPINERHKSDRELFDKLKEKFAIKNDEEKIDGENYQKNLQSEETNQMRVPNKDGRLTLDRISHIILGDFSSVTGDLEGGLHSRETLKVLSDNNQIKFESIYAGKTTNINDAKKTVHPNGVIDLEIEDAYSEEIFKKTFFPETWTDEKIIEAVKYVAGNSAGQDNFVGSYDGVKIRLRYHNGNLSAAYPIIIN